MSDPFHGPGCTADEVEQIKQGILALAFRSDELVTTDEPGFCDSPECDCREPHVDEDDEAVSSTLKPSGP